MSTKLDPPQAQPSISERPRQHLLLAALNFTGASPTECHAGLEQLRAVVKEELAGHLAAEDVETGELGFDKTHNRRQLSILFALSTSGYDRLGAAADQRPVDLHPVPPDVLNPDDPANGAELASEGDVLLHVASDDIFVAEHVLRRVQHELASVFTAAWVQTGVQRYNSRQKGSRTDQRALIGFLDGTTNLSMKNPDDRKLVYTDHTRLEYPANPTPDQYAGAQVPGDLRQPPTTPEPAGLDGGTYMAVEVSLLNTQFFDQQPRSTQEQLVGKAKIDGSAAVNATTASHTMKANPHSSADDELRRMLRRGYSLVRPSGQDLGRGLVFVAFARSLTTQLEFVRRAWINNPNFPTLNAGRDALLFGGAVQVRLVCGGYYFVPPLRKPRDLTSWVTPSAPA